MSQEKYTYAGDQQADGRTRRRHRNIIGRTGVSIKPLVLAFFGCAVCYMLPAVLGRFVSVDYSGYLMFMGGVAYVHILVKLKLT